MNIFPIGTRVFYWLPSGDAIYGTVEGTSFLQDGTQILTIREDDGRVVSLPAVGINKHP